MANNQKIRDLSMAIAISGIGKPMAKTRSDRHAEKDSRPDRGRLARLFRERQADRSQIGMNLFEQFVFAGELFHRSDAVRNFDFQRGIVEIG